MNKRLAAAVWACACFAAERPGEGAQQYRILFAATPSGPRDWTGRVAVAGGELASLRGWRLASGDRAAANGGDFRLRARPDAAGLLLLVRGLESARVTVKLEGITAALEFGAGVPAEGQQPLAAFDGAVRVERLPVETRLSEDGMQDDMPSISIGPDGTAWTAWLSYQDQGDYVVVGDGVTSTRITEKGDHHAPAIAALPNGWLMAAWSRRDDAEFHVYAAFRVAGRWTAGRRMTLLAGSHIWPRLSVDGDGRVALVWQSLREGVSAIRMRLFDGRNWGAEEPVSQDGGGSAWQPVALAAPRRVLFAWDAYAAGSSQIYFREWPNAPERVAAGVRPSLALSPDGKPAAAWEESGRLRLALRNGNGWRALTGDPADSLPPSWRESLQQPQIAFDSAGRLILAFRARTYRGEEGARWETFLTHRDGDRWTRAIPMPASEGRGGMRAALAVDRYRAVVAWPADRRTFPDGKYGDLDIYSARIAVIGPASGLATEPLPPTAETAPAAAERAPGVLRGDLNLRSELSPGGDRSLDDAYRHAIEVAALDFGLIADRQMGAGEEYNWWLSQKAADLYFMPKRFVPLFGYERAVPAPNGGRTIVWAERGRTALGVGADETKGAARSGPILFPSLRRTGGIAIAHAGAVWLDYDPEVEPVAAMPPELLEQAWAKGYRLGAAGGPGVLTCLPAGTELTRQGVLEALRKRKSYAATGGGISLDFRVARGLDIKVSAASPVEAIEIYRNGALAQEVKPGGREAEFAFVDATLGAGESRYHLRVRLTDGNAAWSSPVWVRKAP